MVYNSTKTHSNYYLLRQIINDIKAIHITNKHQIVYGPSLLNYKSSYLNKAAAEPELSCIMPYNQMAYSRVLAGFSNETGRMANNRLVEKLQNVWTIQNEWSRG